MGDPDGVRQGADGSPRGKLTAAVEALYWERPDAAEIIANGMKPKHYQPPKVELWPENEPPLALFTQFATQWRTGPGGAVGLDYGVLFHELDRRDLPAEEYDDTMWAVRVIERAALREMRKE